MNLLSAEHRSILLRLLKGEIDSVEASRLSGLSPRALTAARRRYLKGKLPRIKGTARLPVSAPVRVRRDAWGLAHIEAASLADAYVALGYVTAQERLWGLDYIRRLARGELSEILGPRFLPSDRYLRTVGIGRIADQTVPHLSDEVRLVLESLASGINAGMREAAEDLPVEFDLLGYAPRPWTVADSVAAWKWRWWMLTGRIEQIALAEAVARHLPPDLFAAFMAPEAGEETIVPSAGPSTSGGDDSGEGSNNWVVGGRLSATGRPILATDPHNTFGHPSQWYQAQITCPGMDAVGAFFVGTPGIYLGHNRHVAWGVTNHVASARDLYVETVNPSDPAQYREKGEWRPFEVEEQTIPVQGQPPERLVIRRTLRGPVVNDFLPAIGETPESPLSLRWVGAESTTGFEAMLALHRAASVDDALTALRQWPMPILNFVFAGAEGRIGYHVVGRVPRRRVAAKGFRPANDPDHEWDGVLSFDELPSLIDPPRDWVATANNPPHGDDHPYAAYGVWSDGYRFRRIRKRIQALPRLTPDDVAAIHADVVHGRAEDLAPALARIAAQGSGRALRDAGALLSEWNGAYTTDAVAPTLFSAFWTEWLRRVARARFPERLVPLVAERAGHIARQLLLGERSDWFAPGTDVSAEVRAALSDALAFLRKQVGPRKAQWRWGRLHTVTFRHPISHSAALSRLFDLGPFETSGGAGTVRNAGFSLTPPFEVVSGSTYRMVVDLADPARARATTTGGQSGHPGSPHYGDQARLWVEDRYHPLLMDEKDYADGVEGDMTMKPQE